MLKMILDVGFNAIFVYRMFLGSQVCLFSGGVNLGRLQRRSNTLT